MPVATVAFTKKNARELSTRALRQVQRAMDKDGAVALKNLFSLSLLKRLRQDVLRRHESGELRRRGLVRDIGGRYAALIPFSGPFLDPRFYADGRLHGMMAALLGSDYCIGSLEAVVSLPGSSPQHQHIDGPVRFDRVAGRRKEVFAGDLSGLPPYAVTLCVPLCDVDEANGPTVLWPGSHKTALLAKPPGEAAIARRFPAAAMTGKFGQAFLFDYRTFHRGTPNFSREPRAILMLVFTRGWYRDPNLAEVYPSVVIAKRDLARVPEGRRGLFRLAPAARRALWDDRPR